MSVQKDYSCNMEEHFVYTSSKTFHFVETKAVAVGRFKFSATGKAGLIIVLAWLIIAGFGRWVAPYGENDLPFPDAYGQFQPPQAGALLGTDVDDRDILSRVIYGAGRTIGISFTATAIAYVFGILLGFFAAIAGPKTDMVLSRINDALLSLPTIMLGMVMVAAVGSSTSMLIIVASLVYIPIVFRMARAIGMEIKMTDFIEAAQARGEGPWWIVMREIWPNAAMPLVSDFGLRLIYVTLFLSSLSFLGLGVQPPHADWGSMVRENLGAFQSFGASIVPVIAPAFALATLTIGINLIVDDFSAQAGSKFSRKM
ncbi:ABC transporter permease [Pararhizobium gei]|uniref:ABC transporter permease n=1 Tax=Pararhizobium gei TaxID=1395951 RepID=UPI0023DAB798|nr:ABC transporter permease [Rhizobium gei]